MASPSTTDLYPTPWPRLLFSSSIGTAIEMYDFFIYGTAAALVFNKLFFPDSDPIVGILLAFATYGVGFLARPLGGAVFGHFGDRVGRKRMLVISIMMMGAATFAIGLLPTYAQVGLAAPALLVLLRLIQGFSAGGEWAGAVITATEQAPPGRSGLYGSWAAIGAPLGLLLATGTFKLLEGMPESDFLAWGWRLPFFASAVLVLVGMYIRVGVHEPAGMKALRERGEVLKMPLKRVLVEQWRTVLLGAGVNLGANAFIYLTFTFVLSIAASHLNLLPGTILNATILGAIAQIPAMLLAAHLSDRLGRRPVMVTGAIFLVVWGFVHFAVVGIGDDTLALASTAIAFAGSGFLLGPMGVFLAELFGTTVRYSGASLGSQLGAVFGGGLAPFIATALFAITGEQHLWPIALYSAAGAMVTLVCLLVATRHSAAGRPTREPAAAIRTQRNLDDEKIGASDD